MVDVFYTNLVALVDVFQDKWVPDLMSRLEKFLMLALQAQPQPRLFELYVSLLLMPTKNEDDLWLYSIHY